MKIKKKVGNTFVRNYDLELIVKRMIYIVGFIFLCFIDQMIGSATGYIQFGYKNCTGIIIGVFILTAYKFNDFKKIAYLIWIIIFFVFKFFFLDSLKNIVYNDIEVETNLWGILLYGIIIIRMFYLYIIEKYKPKMNWYIFILWVVMLLGMSIIRTDYAWPKVIIVSFGLFYLTEFSAKDLNNFYLGMTEGIIVGTFIIQVQAWMYRPYDYVRYEGMYSHANMNALLYLLAYCAILSRWYLVKLKKRNILLQIALVMMAGLINGTMFYTGGRAAFITAVVITIVFLFCLLISKKKGIILELLSSWAALLVSIVVCILPSFWLIRYIPASVNEPLYFEADYATWDLDVHIKKNDPINSPKYVELSEAADEMFERYLWFLDEELSNKVERWIRNFPESLFADIDVHAKELSNDLLEPGIDSQHPLDLRDNIKTGYDVRIDIYKYFFKRLNVIGQRNNRQGVWVLSNYLYFAAHCHNVFLQIAYDFGIIIGVVFILNIFIFYIKVLINLLRKQSKLLYYRLFVSVVYMTLFVVFGMLEMDWIYGQLSFTMFFIVQYVIHHKMPEPEAVVEASPVATGQYIVPGKGGFKELVIMDLDAEDPDQKSDS